MSSEEGRIFISYRDEDKASAILLANWLDKKRPGKVFICVDRGAIRTSILDNLKKARHLIFVCSKREYLDLTNPNNNNVTEEINIFHTNRSNNAIKDRVVITAAMQQNLIITYMLGDITHEDLPYPLNEMSVSEEQGYERLLNVILTAESNKPIESTQSALQRDDNNFYKNQLGDYSELERQKAQMAVFEQYDKRLYDKYFSCEKKLNVLDVGCGNGYRTITRFRPYSSVELIFGIDISKKWIDYANVNFSDNHTFFHQVDIESKEKMTAFGTYISENNIGFFDVILISYVLLHVKNPLLVLKLLRRLLKNDGVIIIQDIDDGFCVAYPDYNKRHERIVKICGLLEHAGFRKSGRQIPSYLNSSGYKNISVQEIGLSTLEMSHDTKEDVFRMFYEWIPSSLNNQIKRHPQNTYLQEEQRWLDKNFDEFEKDFFSSEYFSVLGTVSFIATK